VTPSLSHGNGWFRIRAEVIRAIGARSLRWRVEQVEQCGGEFELIDEHAGTTAFEFDPWIADL
jgi:hypothetical protein